MDKYAKYLKERVKYDTYFIKKNLCPESFFDTTFLSFMSVSCTVCFGLFSPEKCSIQALCGSVNQWGKVEACFLRVLFFLL